MNHVMFRGFYLPSLHSVSLCVMWGFSISQAYLKIQKIKNNLTNKSSSSVTDSKLLYCQKPAGSPNKKTGFRVGDPVTERILEKYIPFIHFTIENLLLSQPIGCMILSSLLLLLVVIAQLTFSTVYFYQCQDKN